jgi:hypothetical protein
MENIHNGIQEISRLIGAIYGDSLSVGQEDEGLQVGSVLIAAKELHQLVQKMVAKFRHRHSIQKALIRFQQEKIDKLKDALRSPWIDRQIDEEYGLNGQVELLQSDVNVLTKVKIL